MNRKNVLNFVVLTGQSNSCGFETYEPHSVVQKFGNLMVSSIATGNVISALTEPCAGFGTPAVTGETPASGICNTLAALTGEMFATSCSGEGGHGMEAIRKGGTRFSYAESISAATAAKAYAISQGKTIEYPFVFLIHGENDGVFANGNYGVEVSQMQKDYATDLMALSGQTFQPILICSSPTKAEPTLKAGIEFIEKQFEIARQLNSNVVYIGSLAGYGLAPSGAHHLALAVRRFGEVFGATAGAIASGNFKKADFRIKSITKNDLQVTITFYHEIVGTSVGFDFYHGSTRVPVNKYSINKNLITFDLSGPATSWKHAYERTTDLAILVCGVPLFLPTLKGDL